MEERIRHDLELEIEELEQLLSDRLYDYEQMKAEHLREYPDQDSELAWEASQHHNDYYLSGGEQTGRQTTRQPVSRRTDRQATQAANGRRTGQRQPTKNIRAHGEDPHAPECVGICPDASDGAVRQASRGFVP